MGSPAFQEQWEDIEYLWRIRWLLAGLPQICTTCYWADKSLTSPSAGHNEQSAIAVFPLELSQQQKSEKSEYNPNFTHIYSNWARPVFWSWVMPFDFSSSVVVLEVKSAGIPSNVCTRHFASYWRNYNPNSESPSYKFILCCQGQLFFPVPCRDTGQNKVCSCFRSTLAAEVLGVLLPPLLA